MERVLYSARCLSAGVPLGTHYENSTLVLENGILRFANIVYNKVNKIIFRTKCLSNGQLLRLWYLKLDDDLRSTPPPPYLKIRKKTHYSLKSRKHAIKKNNWELRNSTPCNIWLMCVCCMFPFPTDVPCRWSVMVGRREGLVWSTIEYLSRRS